MRRLEPVAIMHTGFGEKFGIPRQSGLVPEADVYKRQASSTTPCAIPGTDSPSLKLTGERSAPVGTNSIRFNSPLLSFGR